MKLVIDISEEDYRLFKNGSFVEDTGIIFEQSVEDRNKTMALFRMIDAVKNGKINVDSPQTPLPCDYCEVGYCLGRIDSTVRHNCLMNRNTGAKNSFNI